MCREENWIICAKNDINLKQIKPSIVRRCPWNYFIFLEPDTDFFLGCFVWMWSMDYVALDINAKITANGSRHWQFWFGFSKHFPSYFDSIFAFPDHRNDWTRYYVLDHFIIKWTVFMLAIMLFHHLFSCLKNPKENHLQSDSKMKMMWNKIEKIMWNKIQKHLILIQSFCFDLIFNMNNLILTCQHTQINFNPTNLKPLFSKRLIILPTNFRCTASGLSNISVRSISLLIVGFISLAIYKWNFQ